MDEIKVLAVVLLLIPHDEQARRAVLLYVRVVGVLLDELLRRVEVRDYSAELDVVEEELFGDEDVRLLRGALPALAALEIGLRCHGQEQRVYPVGHGHLGALPFRHADPAAAL